LPVPNPTLIYRITHVGNLRWLLANGLHCANSGTQDPNFVQIGLPDLIQKRSTRPVPIPPGGTLDDYIPFYFGTHSVMLYNIHTGYGVKQVYQKDMIYVVSSIQRLVANNVHFLFTDRHAYVANAHYSGDIAELARLDWDLINGRDFKRDPNRPDKLDLRAAELLVHRHLPISALVGIACYNDAARQVIEGEASASGANITVRVHHDWYF
jgi:hypothetical protein